MSFIAPCLPETAPFSPAQRAWLDGFLAGLLSEGRNEAAIAPPGYDDRGRTEPAASSAEPEDLPWHDPALPLDERLDLAAGRRPEHRLMAAMAQLDCGQCGYLCDTYAEAIARGEEKQLTRCAPGGKATSRALKELVASLATPPTGAVPAAPVAAAAPLPRPAAPGDEAFAARLLAAQPLNRAGSEKDTRQIMLAADAGLLAYEVGDSLGVVARNSPELVRAIIERLDAGPR
jgi:sulfite reductase (NADPH) flavoprotein alpha-component